MSTNDNPSFHPASAAHFSKADVRRHRLHFELAPSSEILKIVVDRIAVNIAKLEEADQASQILLSAGSGVLTSTADGTSGEPTEVIKALQMASRPLARLGQNAATAERNLRSYIHVWRDLQRDLRPIHRDEPYDERQCIDFLMQRFAAPTWTCPKCGSAVGTCLQRRGAWECRACEHQVGVRAGTIMERSQVPLGVWFRAVKMLIDEPNISGRKLTQVMNLRPQTAHNMRRRIIEALDRPDQRHRLAGLDRLFGANLSQVCHPRALPKAVTPHDTATEAVSSSSPALPPETGVSCTEA